MTKEAALTKFRCECGRLLLVEGQVIGKEHGVEAGDRALETARKVVTANNPYHVRNEHICFCAECEDMRAAVIQSAMNDVAAMNPPERVCNFAEHLEPELLRIKLSAMNAQERELLLLAGRLLESQSPEWGDVDGASIEEWLIEAGLLNQVDVTEPCDPENCVCAEFGFPGKCNRRTELGERAERLLAERGGTV